MSREAVKKGTSRSRRMVLRNIFLNLIITSTGSQPGIKEDSLIHLNNEDSKQYLQVQVRLSTSPGKPEYTGIGGGLVGKILH